MKIFLNRQNLIAKHVVPSERIPISEWHALRQKTIRLLNAQGAKQAASWLEQTDYEFWTFGVTTNPRPARKITGFYQKVSIERYGKMIQENRYPQVRLDQTYAWVGHVLNEFGYHLDIVAVELNEDDEVQTVPTIEKLSITATSVEAALIDAESAIAEGKPENAVDRLHTVFHGYLEEVCQRSEISFKEDTSITGLFSLIRHHHPKFKVTDQNADGIVTQINRGLSQVVDALNPLRNSFTLAHPNPLLDKPEAYLAINTIRTLLHYMEMKLK